jgi:Adenylate and Guanylate cyclase catalytic domain
VAKPTASTPKAKRLQEIWVAETKKDALAIADHRGEILKFIGDGLLAIFPLAAFEGIADAAMNAMAAAHEALAAVHAIEHESLGSELLKMVVALHYGTVIYGNIGAADRLDFTVMQRSASFLVSATQISCNRFALGVLAVGFATAFDGLLQRSIGSCGYAARRAERSMQLTFAPLSVGRFQSRPAQPLCRGAGGGGARHFASIWNIRADSSA